MGWIPATKGKSEASDAKIDLVEDGRTLGPVPPTRSASEPISRPASWPLLAVGRSWIADAVTSACHGQHPLHSSFSEGEPS